MVRKKLIDYLEKNKITVYQFAKKSGIPQSTIRSIVQKEDYEVREGNIQKICAGMGMTPYEMFLTESDEIVFLNQDKIPVIKNYRKLHKEDQCRVQGYLDALLEKHIDIFRWIVYTVIKEAHVALTVGISRPLTETFISGRISALSETYISECFATQRAKLTAGQSNLSRLY